VISGGEDSTINVWSIGEQVTFVNQDEDGDAVMELESEDATSPSMQARKRKNQDEADTNKKGRTRY